MSDMTEYEKTMLDAQISTTQAIQKGAGVMTPSMQVKKQIEGLKAKLKWPHLTRAEIASLNDKIKELGG